MSVGARRGVKHQAPTSKLQRSSKFQAPSGACIDWCLGVWCFSELGFWFLVLYLAPVLDIRTVTGNPLGRLCRFLSFFVRSVSGKVKSLSGREIGRERSVRIAVQHDCPKSFPFSRLLRAPLRRRHALASRVRAGCVAQAGPTGTDSRLVA